MQLIYEDQTSQTEAEPFIFNIIYEDSVNLPACLSQ